MIDKNIRLEPHHSRDLLVGRRSDNKRPKYQPPGHGTGGGRGRDPGPSGPPGGGDRQMTYSAPAPAPAPTRSRQESVAREEKAKVDAQRAEQANIDLEFYRDPIRDLADEQKEKDKKMLQQRMDIANQFQIPLDYSATDLQARAKRAMTQPGFTNVLEPYDPNVPKELQFWDGRPFTKTPYDPYKVDTTPVGTVSKNPIGGLDQFAREMEALEKARAGDTVTASELGGTLQDFYTNKQPYTGKFKVIGDDINFRSVPSKTPGDDKLPAGLGDVPGDEMFKPVKKYAPPVRHHGIDTGEEAYEMVGGVKVPLSMRGVKGVDPREDPTKFGETVEGPDLRTERETGEDWERAQDWDLIKDMSAKGYDSNEIQGAMEKGLTAKTGPRLRQNLIESGLRSLRNVVPETGLERSLLGRAKRFMPGAPGAKEGIMGWGGKMIKNYALSKLGLGWLNPALGVASLFGFNPFKNMRSRYSVPRKEQPTVGGDGPAPANVIQAGIEKFQPTEQQTAQIDEMRRKMMILQGHADKGALNEQGMNTLAQMNQLISQYQVDPRSIYG